MICGSTSSLFSTNMNTIFHRVSDQFVVLRHRHTGTERLTAIIDQPWLANPGDANEYNFGVIVCINIPRRIKFIYGLAPLQKEYVSINGVIDKAAFGMCDNVLPKPGCTY